MTPSASVAVVIVNWNSGGDLEKCLEALSHQSLRPKRILVIDNASTDDSLQAVERFFPLADLVCLDENTGFAEGNNRVVKLCEGCEWIAFLNPDAFAAADWLKNLLSCARRRREYSFFGSHMLRFSANDVLDGTGDLYHVSGLAWRRDHGLSASRNRRSTAEVFGPCAAAALIRRDVFLAAGGFDASYHSYFEDVDLAFRLRLLGHRCLYVRDAVVRHVGSGSTHRYSDYAVYHGHRNGVWTYVKNMPHPLIWVYLPQHLLANLAACVWFAFRKKGRVAGAAKRDALLQLPRIWRRRKQIQSQIRVHPRKIRQVLCKGLWTPYSKNKRAL